MYTSTTSITTSHQQFKRVKERLVSEAIEKVELWRSMFTNGYKASDGSIYRVTLNKAAELVGIPKKTLEDYTQLFKKVEYLTKDLNQFSNQKMGYLRSYLRKNQTKLKKILKEIRIKELEAQKKANEVMMEEQKRLLQKQSSQHSEDNDTTEQILEDSLLVINEMKIEQSYSNDIEMCQEQDSLNFFEYDNSEVYFGRVQKFSDPDSCGHYFQSTDESL